MKDTAKETSDAEHYAAIGHNPTESGFKQALRASSVVLASFVVLGLGLGVIISAHHLPWWLAPAISLIVYAGSVEFLVVEMIATGASVGAIGFTTLLVNSRHLVYGISFPLQNVKGFWAKLYAIYTLCDESYALNTGPDRNTLSHARILWVSTFLHISWVVGTTAGFFIGASFLSHLEGMDFAMTALFTILAIDAYRAQRHSPSHADLWRGGYYPGARFHASGVDGNLHCPADSTVLHRKITGKYKRSEDSRVCYYFLFEC